MRRFVLDSLSEQKDASEIEIQRSHDRIINSVKTQLEAQDLNLQHKFDQLTKQTQLDNEMNSKANLTALKNEVLPKISLQTKLIETQQLEIQTISQNLNKVETEIDAMKQKPLMTQPTGPIQVICTGSENSDRQIPKFNGRSGNPNEYLNRLKRYYNRGLERNAHMDPVEYLKDTLETSFEGPASRWLQLIRADICNWDQFVKEFETKYWSQAVQRGIKSKIESEKYRNNGTLSRTEYFTERVLLLQSMSPSLTEEEIVCLMAERFDSIIQDSVSVQNITTIKSMEKLLQKEDIREGPKRNKVHNTNAAPNSRPNSPNGNNPQQYQGRYENQRAYQPKLTHKPYYQKQENYQSNHTPYRNYNQQRYNGNNNNPQSKYHYHQNKPYQRNHEPYPKQERNYPTREQNQVCAIYTQTANPRTPPPINQHPVNPNNSSPQNHEQSENRSAL